MSQGVQNRSAKNFGLRCGVRMACVTKNARSFENSAGEFRKRACSQVGITQTFESNRPQDVS